MKCPYCGQVIQDKEAHSAWLEWFEMFWKHYPRKQAKKDAKKAFLKLAPSDQLYSVIIHDINIRKKTEAWKADNGKFIPLPATYLRGERWEDEVGKEVYPEECLSERLNPICEKCGNEEAAWQYVDVDVPPWDDGPWLCRDCWPEANEKAGHVLRNLLDITKEA